MAFLTPGDELGVVIEVHISIQLLEFSPTHDCLNAFITKEPIHEIVHCVRGVGMDPHDDDTYRMGL